MKGIIGTPMHITKLFTKNLTNKIKDVPLNYSLGYKTPTVMLNKMW